MKPFIPGKYCFLLIIAIIGCQPKQQPPNILFILADDHTSQAIGAYESRFTYLNPTPTIDRLAEEGMLFQNVFCTNSICTPSRATILTGQYNHTNGVRDLYDSLPVEKQYLPLELKKVGYQTAVVGKWHVRTSPEAFDYYKVLPGQGQYYDPVLYSRDEGELNEVRIDSKLTRKLRIKKYQGHSSDVLTDITLDWLQNKRNKNQPFFLMHNFKAPHDMFEPARRYDQYLENVDFPEPETGYEPDWGSIATRGKNDSLIHYIGSSLGKRNHIRNMGKDLKIDQDLDPDEYRERAYQTYMKRYFRCVKGIDDNLKRIFDYLENNNLMENTLIIYSADQGFFMGEHDFIDKRWMYEESLRMPLMIRYPKIIPPGSLNNWIINNADFAPTLLDLAGLPAPEYMQGKSFLPALNGKKQPSDWREAHYYRYWMHMAHNHNNPAHFGVRTDRYKLIFFYGTDFIKDGEAENDGNRFRPDTPVAWELYDLKNDPHETRNIYQAQKNKDIVKELKRQLVDLRSSLNDQDHAFPHIREIISRHWQD